MNTSGPETRLRQRGMVTVMAVLFLITAVIFVLSQTLGISGTSSIDNMQQMDSTAAMFLAESGLERGQGVLTAANPITNTVCTGIAGTYSLGRGSFTLSGTSTPANCDSSGATPCTSCAIQATGTVGAASRTLTRTMSLTAVNGTSCNAGTTDCTNATAPPPTWKMVLKNTYANTAIALFNLTTRRQGNQTAAGCTNANCALEWNINAQNGSNSVGNMGNAVTIPSGASYDIYQTLNSNRNLTEVGALFPGNSAPSLTGRNVAGGAAYWSEPNSGSGGTIGKSADSSGTTNNGTATDPATDTCTTTPVTGSTQACTTWCYGGDTLVFGFGAHSSTGLTDALSSVTFNTAGTPTQNIALSRIAKFPNSSIPGAPTDVYSEVWYVHNPNLSPATAPAASNASSYKGNGTAAIGATWTGNGGNSASGTTLTVGNSPAGYPSSIISIGDTISSTGGVGNNIDCSLGCPTIVSQLSSSETGGALGGRGTYQLSSSQTVSASNPRAWTASSTTLHVSACTICFFAQSDAISGLISGRTINSPQLPLQTGETAAGVGRYPLSGTATVVASGAVLAGTPGTTVYLPSSQSMPTVTTPNTRIAIASGTGVFSANTTVTAVTSPAPNAATNSFTVSTAPTTALNLATICAGTCAFFDHASATTAFAIGKPSNTDYWASGFMCLKGADITPIPVTSSTVKASTWHEVVQ